MVQSLFYASHIHVHVPGYLCFANQQKIPSTFVASLCMYRSGCEVCTTYLVLFFVRLSKESSNTSSAGKECHGGRYHQSGGAAATVGRLLSLFCGRLGSCRSIRSASRRRSSPHGGRSSTTGDAFTQVGRTGSGVACGIGSLRLSIGGGVGSTRNSIAGGVGST